ncbi:MAG: HlyD family efflux transporter periplasmic adaptor subunit, partial [Nannocystaceae bacterium]|nr:HlyD family efflux transporter periplasmic adaptor subunit [Nannocystaceae bacterium]
AKLCLLGKISIRAPFNATVLSESIEVGEIVSPGKVLATLVGTDRFWARLSLPVEDLAFVDFPQGDAPGSKVTVTQELSSGKTVVRSGSVLRLVGSLDAQSRTAQVIVEIDRPLDPPPGELPLLIGAFVSAEIEGRLLEGARAVPRKAVFDGNRVWVVDQDGALRRRTLTIALADDQRVVATAGVEVDDRVVMTPIRTPTEGMKVRIEEAEDGQEDPQQEPSDAG